MEAKPKTSLDFGVHTRWSVQVTHTAIAMTDAAEGLRLTTGSMLQVQSANGNISLERVAEAGRDAPLLMFQLYVFKDRVFTSKVIKSMLAPTPCVLPHSCDA